MKKCSNCNSRPMLVKIDSDSGYATCIICHRSTPVCDSNDTFKISWKKYAKQAWDSDIIR